MKDKRQYIYIPSKEQYVWLDDNVIKYSKKGYSGYRGKELENICQWLNQKEIEFTLEPCPYDITYSDFFNIYNWKGTIVKTSPYPTLLETLTAIKTGCLDININLQSIGNLQREYLWDQPRASKFLLYWLMQGSTGIGTISICQKYKTHEKCYLLDGKQRLISIQKFFDGEIPILLHNQKYYISQIHPSIIDNAMSGHLITDFYGYNMKTNYDDIQLIKLFAYLNYQHLPQEITKTENIKELIQENYIDEKPNKG